MMNASISSCECSNSTVGQLNIFIDRILDVVYANAGNRSIIFSSFHPETCLMLNFKVRISTVLFQLTAADPVSLTQFTNAHTMPHT